MLGTLPDDSGYGWFRLISCIFFFFFYILDFLHFRKKKKSLHLENILCQSNFKLVDQKLEEKKIIHNNKFVNFPIANTF